MWFIFPPHLNSVSALPCKTDKHRNSIFSLNVLWLFYWKLQKHVVHGLFIDSSIPLSKQPTAGVRNVLPSREHTPADAFSTRWQQRQQHFAADRFKRQPVAARVRRHCGSASRTHAAAWSPKSCNQRGSGPDGWGAIGLEKWNQLFHAAGVRLFYCI